MHWKRNPSHKQPLPDIAASVRQRSELVALKASAGLKLQHESGTTADVWKQ